MATPKEHELRRRFISVMESTSSVPDFPSLKRDLEEMEREVKKRRKGVNPGAKRCNETYPEFGEGAEVWIEKGGDVREEIAACICSASGGISSCRNDYPTEFSALLQVFKKGRVEIELELYIHQDEEQITHNSGKHSEFPEPTAKCFFTSSGHLTDEEKRKLAVLSLDILKKKCSKRRASRYFPKVSEVEFRRKEDEYDWLFDQSNEESPKE